MAFFIRNFKISLTNPFEYDTIRYGKLYHSGKFDRESTMADYSSLSDLELLANNSPDSAKTTELISRYMKMVLAAARKFSERYICADYEDFVSDGMDGLLSAIRGYDKSRGEFGAYASVCVTNRLRNTARMAQRHSSNLHDADFDDLVDIADPAPTPEEVVLAKESYEIVLRNVASELSELERKCIFAATMGLSYTEIANEFRVDIKTVDNALSRARAKLRKMFSNLKFTEND